MNITLTRDEVALLLKGMENSSTRTHMNITLTRDEVALLLKGMETIIKMASRMKWALPRVQEYIDLLHKIDEQTLSRHDVTSPE